MRVLLSCLQSLQDHRIPAYAFWRPYFVEGLKEAGVECVEVPGVDWAEGLVHAPGEALDRWREKTWNTVLAFARKEHERKPIDCFLGYLYPQQVEADAIQSLQRIGVPCVNFFCDNFREFRQVPAQYHCFDLHWVPEFEALPMYRRAGLPHVHAPMPCWVPSALRQVAFAETEPATFVGSPDALRRNLLGQALELGAPFVVRGPGWAPDGRPDAPGAAHKTLGQLLQNQWDLVRRHGAVALWRKLENRFGTLDLPPIPEHALRPAVWGEEYARVTREASVILGVNRVPTVRSSLAKPLAYSRLRDIEAPMLGACYLTEWTAGLGELYELGTEIESYRTADELRLKLEDLLRDNERRRRMRYAAQHRALADHSVSRTFARITEQLGLQTRRTARPVRASKA